MLRTTLAVVLTLSSIALCSACHRASGSLHFGSGPDHVGSGVSARTTRALPAFERVHVTGAIELHFRPGSAHAIEIQGDDNLLALFESNVSGDTLKLSFGSGSYKPKVPFVVWIEAPRLAGLTSAGSLDADLEQLSGDEFELRTSGATKLRATGQVERASYEGRGSLDVDAFELRAGRVAIDTAGSATLRVTASETLDVDLKGSGEVRYRGNPKITKSVSGIGKIVPE